MQGHRSNKHVVVSALLSVTGTVLAQSYSITDLGTLEGGFSSSAAAINNRGQVVGVSDISTADMSGRRGFIDTHGTKVILGFGDVLLALSSEATAINAVGQTVFNVSNGAPHAFLYSAGAVAPLTTIPDAIYSEAFAINSRGQVAGTVVRDAGGTFPHHAFLYSDGVMTDLDPLLFDGDYSEGAGINDRGDVVGDARLPSGFIHAYVLRAGVVHDLGTLGGDSSSASAVNHAGQIVGYSYLNHGAPGAHAFLYDGGHMNDLGLLPGATGSSAAAINSTGLIVGESTFPGWHNTRAFVYAGGAMRDLNTLLRPGTGWVLQTATGVNDLGQIVGQGTIAGRRLAFLLKPPVTLAAESSRR